MADRRDEKPRLVTVLMAAHNDERFVSDAIDSVLSQTMPDFKFVIVDDSSTDSTPVVLERFARLDDRIQIIRNETNLGLTKSLNVGLQHVRSRFVARFDADDVCMKERLEKQSAYMEAHPECDFLGSRAVVINDSGRYIKKTKPWPRGRDVRRYLLDVGSPFVHSSMMMRKSALDELGGYNEDWQARQDYELWLRAAFANKRFACLDHCLVYYRFHDSSFSVRTESNLLCNLLLRGYYRAKDKGQVVDLAKLRQDLEASRLLRKYVGHVKIRRAVKTTIGNLHSRNIVGSIRGLARLVRLFLVTGVPIGKFHINSILDHLCSLQVTDRGSRLPRSKRLRSRDVKLADTALDDRC